MTVGQGAPIPAGSDPNDMSGIDQAAHNTDLERRVAAAPTWADPSMAIAMGNSGMSDATLATAWQGFQDLASKTLNDWVAPAIEDPVLHKTPSKALAVNQWLGEQRGYAPVEQSDVAHIQQQLQAKGYATGLPTDGVWTSEWNGQHQQAWYDYVQNQQDNVGQPVPVHKVAHGFLHSLLPSVAIPAIIGYFKSIPGNIRSGMADFAGGVTTIGTGIKDTAENFGMVGGRGPSHAEAKTPVQAGAQVAANVENVGNQGKKVTAEDILAHPYARLINDFGTALLVVPYGKVAEEVSQTIGKALFEDNLKGLVTRSLPQEVATRGPGIISKTLIRDQEGNGMDLAGRFMRHTPGMRNFYPTIQKAYGSPGVGYYAWRTGLAQPMRNPLINFGVRTGQYVSMLGAETRGVAAVESAAGGRDQGLAASVYKQPSISGRWATALNLWGAVGTPTLGADPSQHVGDIIRGADSVYHAILGNAPDVANTFNQALKSAGADLTYQKMVKEVGQPAADEIIHQQVQSAAAANVAKARIAQEEELTGIHLQGQPLKAKQREYGSISDMDPAILQEAGDELLQNKQALFRSFHQTSNTIRENAEGSNGLQKFVDAKAPANSLIQDYAHILVHPDNLAVVKDLRQQAADEAAWNAEPAPFFSNPVGTQLFTNAGESPEDVLAAQQPGKYGSGIRATSTRPKGEGVHYLTAKDQTAPYQFADLDHQASEPLKKAIRYALTSPEGRAQHDGGSNLLNSPAAYKTVRKLLVNKVVTGKRLLDSYRASLEAAGNLSQRQIDEEVNKIQASATKGLAGYRYTDRPGRIHVITNPDLVEAGAASPLPPTIDASAATFQEHGVAPAAGMLGIARKDTMLAPDMRHAADELMTRLHAAGLGSAVDDERMKLELEGVDAGGVLDQVLPIADENRDAEVKAVMKDASDLLWKHAGYDPIELNVMQNHVESLVGQIYREAAHHSTPVTLPLGAPQAAVDRMKELDDLGYKLVYGKDIGHVIHKPLIDPFVVQGHTRWLRKVAGYVGINNEHIANQDIGMVRTSRAAQLLDKANAEGRIKLGPFQTGAQFLAHISNFSRDMGEGPVGSALFALSTPLHKAAIRARMDRAAEEGFPINKQEAIALVKADMSHGVGLNMMSQKQFVEAAQQNPPELSSLYETYGLADDVPAMSVHHAQIAHALVLQANASAPTWMTGAARLEDMFRAAPSFLLNKTLNHTRIPTISFLANRSAMLPNDLIRMRNQFKFAYSPIFDARRMAKTNFKMAVDGIAPTLSPLGVMERKGSTAKDLGLVDRLIPEGAIKGQGFDAQDRWLQQTGIFGFNVRHYMGYAAGVMKEQGVADDAIKDRLIHIFTYGDRTALERSIGTIWYPFSFQKTLYRNVGAHLLDNGSQRLILTSALNAYHSLDQNGQQPGVVQTWLDKHLPVARELEKLNAFTEGVSMGQFGGINMPLLNMFLPQHNRNPLGASTLQALVPAYNDLNALLIGHDPKTGIDKGGELQGQVYDSKWFAYNLWHDIVGTGKGSLLSQHHPAETPQAQQEDGYKFRNALIVKAAAVLAYNDHNPNNALIFPNTDNIPAQLRGVKVTRTSLGTMTQLYYPAYDPSTARDVAESKQTAAKAYLQKMIVEEPNRAVQYQTFADMAATVRGHVTRGEYDHDQMKALTQQFRDYAVTMSEQDPRFYKFYNQYFASLFGPLENIQ